MESETMQGEIIAADFEENTLTFSMHGNYYAKAGTYMLVPIEEWRELVRNTGGSNA